jgi:NAD(P)-dependent dehydrogenase (short-subunit alcohol dehydrogenase family)
MPAKSKQELQRVALVTGGSHRIGRAISLALVKAGYAVIVHALHSRGEAEQLSGEIAEQGGRAAVVVADLARGDQVSRLIPAADAFGALTLLVNNASVFEPDDVTTFDAARFDQAMAVNLRAPLALSRAFAAQAPRGANASIVNLLDQRVFKPTPRFLSYTLSKSALFTATSTLAQALAPDVRVNGVAPGPVLPSPRQTADEFARQAAAMPLGHGPVPEEIAEAVLYLAAAASVTGQTIAVDGGQHLAWRTADNDIAE